MSRRIKYGFAVLLALLIGLCLYRLFYHPYIPGVPGPAFRLSAAALAETYDNGEAHADSLYLDKTLSVNGILAGIHQNESGRIVLTLAGHQSGKTAVDCLLDTSYSVDHLRFTTGDRLTVIGRCAGRSFNVLLVQCVVR